MDFELTEVQRSWRGKAQALGHELPVDIAAADVVRGASRVGLLDPNADFVAVAIAVEALACESAAAGMTLALHTSAMCTVTHEDRFEPLARGETVGALALSSEDVPVVEDGRLTGRASWVGPITDHGLTLVGARGPQGIVTCIVPLDVNGVSIAPVSTTALRGVVWAYVTFAGVSCMEVGTPVMVMTRARTLIAASALGIGDRALRESLACVHRERGAGGEQTVQGLLADTATDLDAARLLTWNAATQAGNCSLADASMAKLAATAAAQAAVVRATQVVGVESMRSGHVIERLTQDVRAIELFAGRTEALRESVAHDALPSVTA